MIAGRASSLGWGAFLLTGIAAAMAGQGWQFAFAGGAIALLGLPHGASDLAIVARNRRAGFLLAYLGCIVGVMAVWLVDPVLALALLLALSAAHFALDGRPQPGAGDWAIGGFLVGGPALLHAGAVTGLFAAATGNASAAAILARVLQLIGFAATIVLVWRVARADAGPRDRGLRVAAMTGTLVLPPLVGFAIGFVLLHARAQTTERQHAIGCATLGRYLSRVAPLMAGAVGVLALVALLVLDGAGGRSAFLFAGIAALATPHMLVTPLWQRRAPIAGSWFGAGKASLPASRHRPTG